MKTNHPSRLLCESPSPVVLICFSTIWAGLAAAEPLSAGTVVPLSAGAPFEKPATLAPLEQIRPGAGPAMVPTARGKTYDTIVPDTCDLAERARLFVENYLMATTVPELDYEPFDWGFYDQIPPRQTLGWGDYICAWPKFRESLPLMRMMIGNEVGFEIDRTWASHLLKSIGPDGLIYVSNVGRPWDKFKAYPWVTENPTIRHYTYLPTLNGRHLGVLSIYYRMTGDETWNEAGRRIVDRMNELAIDVGDAKIFPRFLFLPEEEVPRAEIDRAIESMKEQSKEETERNFPLWHTWMVVGLSQYYRASGYEPARELAQGLANYMRESEYIEKWGSHFHCITLGIHAMLELAQATGDMELARYAREQYEVAKSGARSEALPEIGYYVNGQGRNPMEGCSIADMTAIAVKLAQLGLADWEDVDIIARNTLIEAQRTRPYQVEEYCRKLVERGKAKAEPVDYTHLTDRLSERSVGSWSLHVMPNDLFGDTYYVTCCTGNCSRALYYAWESILDFEDGVLTANLLLNRASPWADLDSYIPYTGRVDLTIKQPCASVKVRMNNWIDKEKVKCSVDGEARSYSWEGQYLVAGKAEPGNVITLEFPIEERTVTLESYEHKYEAVFKGNDCVSIEPGGENVPIFRRAHYRESRPRFIKVKRFACENTIQH